MGPIDAGSQIVVERPKVVHSNGQFVMWLHLDVSENTVSIKEKSSYLQMLA